MKDKTKEILYNIYLRGFRYQFFSGDIKFVDVKDAPLIHYTSDVNFGVTGHFRIYINKNELILRCDYVNTTSTFFSYRLCKLEEHAWIFE